MAKPSATRNAAGILLLMCALLVASVIAGKHAAYSRRKELQNYQLLPACVTLGSQRQRIPATAVGNWHTGMHECLARLVETMDS